MKPAFSLRDPLLRDALELFLQMADLRPDHAPVRFDLRLAGTLRADAAELL